MFVYIYTYICLSILKSGWLSIYLYCHLSAPSVSERYHLRCLFIFDIPSLLTHHLSYSFPFHCLSLPPVRRSSITYSGHSGGVTDLCVIENSHSVASASTDGQVHVWRIELASSSSRKRAKDVKEGSLGAVGGMQTAASVGGSQSQSVGLSVRALSVVRCVNPDDGRVTALQHRTGNVSSIVVYCTQRGAVVGWDLRCAGEAFRYTVRPEFGVPTCMALPSDSSSVKGAVLVGTSRGYILMWDSRFDLMVAAWRHTCNGPIHQISCIQSRISFGEGVAYPSSSPTSPLEEDDDTYDTLDMDIDLENTQRDSAQGVKIGSDRMSREYLVIAAGCNETSIWSLPLQNNSAAVRCFKATSVANSRNKMLESDVPRLISVPLPSHPHTTVQQAISSLLSPTSTPPPISEGNSHSMRSFLIGNADGHKPYLLTGGTDGLIRHWDWNSPTRCCVLAGLSPAQHKPAIVNVRIPRQSRSGGDGMEEDYRNGGGGGGGGVGERMDSRTKHSGSMLSSMFVCYDTSPPSPSSSNGSFIAQAHLPLRDSKGTTHTSNASTVILILSFSSSSFHLSISLLVFTPPLH